MKQILRLIKDHRQRTVWNLEVYTLEDMKTTPRDLLKITTSDLIYYWGHVCK